MGTPSIDEIWEEVKKKLYISSFDASSSILTDVISSKASTNDINTTIDYTIAAKESEIKSQIEEELSGQLTDLYNKYVFNNIKMDSLTTKVNDYETHNHDELYLSISEKQKIIDDVTEKILGSAPIEALDTLIILSDYYKNNSDEVQTMVSKIDSVEAKVDINKASLDNLPVLTDLEDADKNIIYRTSVETNIWDNSTNIYKENELDYYAPIFKESPLPDYPQTIDISLYKSGLSTHPIPNKYGVYMYIPNTMIDSNSKIYVPLVTDELTILTGTKPTPTASTPITHAPYFKFEITDIKSNESLPEIYRIPVNVLNGKLYFVRGKLTEQKEAVKDALDTNVYWMPNNEATELVYLITNTQFSDDGMMSISEVNRNRIDNKYGTKNLKNPTDTYDAVNKNYVDSNFQENIFEIQENAFGKTLNFIAPNNSNNIETNSLGSLTLVTENSTIKTNSTDSMIVGGKNTFIAESGNSLIINSGNSHINKSEKSGILGGLYNIIENRGNGTSTTNGIIQGQNNNIFAGRDNMIANGRENTICTTIETPTTETVSIYSSCKSEIIGGKYSTIMNGLCNKMSNSNYSVLKGEENTIKHIKNSIITGHLNDISFVDNSLVIGEGLEEDGVKNGIIFGKYNSKIGDGTGNNNKYILLAGQGIDDSNRKNIFGLTNEGELFIPKDASDGFVLTSDANGLANWKEIQSPEDPYQYTKNIQKETQDSLVSTYNLNDNQSYSISTTNSTLALTFVQPNTENKSGNLIIKNTNVSSDLTVTFIKELNASFNDFLFINGEHLKIKPLSTTIYSWWYDGNDIYITNGNYLKLA